MTADEPAPTAPAGEAPCAGRPATAPAPRPPGRPRGLSGRPGALIALVLAAAYLAARLAGLAEHTSVLSATGTPGPWEVIGGLSYLVLHVLLVALVPVLLIAAVLIEAVAAIHRRRAAASAPQSHAFGGGGKAP